MSVNGTLVKDELRRFKGECAHFSFNKCPIYTYDGASAKYSTNSHETDNSVPMDKSVGLVCALIQADPKCNFSQMTMDSREKAL